MTPSAGSMHIRKGAGDALWFLGELYEIKVDGSARGGPTVVQVTVPPGPVLGAPPHVHDSDEVATVLEGTLRFHFGDQTEDAGPGSVLHFPKGTPEWFENTTKQAAKLFIVYSGGRIASFFKEVGEPAKTRTLPPPMAGQPDLEKLGKIAKKYGLEIRAPPQ